MHYGFGELPSGQARWRDAAVAGDDIWISGNAAIRGTGRLPR
jgi:hypothetical protein